MFILRVDSRTTRSGFVNWRRNLSVNSESDSLRNGRPRQWFSWQQSSLYIQLLYTLYAKIMDNKFLRIFLPSQKSKMATVYFLGLFRQILRDRRKYCCSPCMIEWLVATKILLFEPLFFTWHNLPARKG